MGSEKTISLNDEAAITQLDLSALRPLPHNSTTTPVPETEKLRVLLDGPSRLL